MPLWQEYPTQVTRCSLLGVWTSGHQTSTRIAHSRFSALQVTKAVLYSACATQVSPFWSMIPYQHAGMYKFVHDEHRDTYKIFYCEFTGKPLDQTLAMPGTNILMLSLSGTSEVSVEWRSWAHSNLLKDFLFWIYREASWADFCYARY